VGQAIQDQVSYRYRLKELAARRGVTLKEISEATGINVEILYSMSSRRKRYNTTIETLLRLCRFLRVSLDELVEVEDEDQPNE